MKLRLATLWRRSFSSDQESQFITDGLHRLEKQAVHVGGSEVYAQLLQWCGSARNVCQGRKVHHHLVRHGYGSNTFLGNCLIQMYRKCSCLDEGKTAFDSMPRKDVVSWNALISGYVENGSSRAALDLYLNMDSHGVQPNRITFVSVVGACGNLQDVSECAAVHARIRSCKLLPDVVLETALLTMYAKCGNVDEARRVFEGITRKNVISWTAMITGYAQCGHHEKAAELYERMDKEAIEPNRITFISALTAFSNLGDIQAGERIHARVLAQKMELDGSLGNALVSMYARCGRIDRARKVFESLPRKNVVSWTSMISAYTHNGMAGEALELYRRMDLEPNSITYITVLTACSALGVLDDGAAVHSRIVSTGFQPDTALLTALVTMYGNCGSLEQARRVFDGMEEKNVMSWNSMLGAYAHFDGDEALKLFRSMELHGVHANAVTLISVLGACASLGALKQGKEVHRRVVSMNLLPDSVLETALVNMYSKCHKLHEARRVFDDLEYKDVVSWTTMIAAYAQEGCSNEALKLYKTMVSSEHIEPNLVTFVAVLGACVTPDTLHDGREIHQRIVGGRFREDELVQNSLLNMYSKCGSVEEAREVFEAMKHRTVVSWNTMLTAYVQAGRGREAIELYERMQAEAEVGEVDPDETTVVTVLAACSNVGEFEQGRAFHTSPKVGDMRNRKRKSSIVVENAIVNLHGKCGFLEEGRVIFERMEVKNLVTWTAMIVGYAQHGHGREAFDMYRRMHLDGAEPDAITFITIFIACSHSGLVWDGRDCFLSMAAEWRISPNAEHYICMVDLLGRAGWLEEAEELTETMPFEPEAVAWMTLLGSCKIHHDSDRARRVEAVIMERNPEMIGSHVLLSNIYLQGGQSSTPSDVDCVSSSQT